MTANLPDWMGKYPRKGADWSPEEDAQLESVMGTRVFIADVAARHLREPVAIERRLALLRDRQKIKDQYDKMKTWRQEQETAREAIAKFRREFPKDRQYKCGDIIVYDGEPCYVARVELGAYGGRTTIVVVAPCTDLPPEVAQALQFGEGEAHAHD